MILGKINARNSLNYDAQKLLKLRSCAANAGKLRFRWLKYRCDSICKKNGAFIPMRANISADVSFPHGINGVFISNGAVIGSGCVIFHQVTIGSNNLTDTAGRGAPTIGDNVYIGAGAKIIGNVHVGNNVRIGANAVVVKDVPDNSTVVLQEARVIVHDKARDNSFVAFK